MSFCLVAAVSIFGKIFGHLAKKAPAQPSVTAPCEPPNRAKDLWAGWQRPQAKHAYNGMAGPNNDVYITACEFGQVTPGSRHPRGHPVAICCYDALGCAHHSGDLCTHCYLKGNKIEMATTTTMNTWSELTIEEVNSQPGAPPVCKTDNGVYLICCTYCTERSVPHLDGQTKWKNRQKSCMIGMCIARIGDNTSYYNIMCLEIPWTWSFHLQSGQLVKWKCPHDDCVEYLRDRPRDKWQGLYCYWHGG